MSTRAEIIDKGNESRLIDGNYTQALRLAALLMRGVVALYTRKIRFLHDDCMRAMSRLNSMRVPMRADKNLLATDELEEGGGNRGARADAMTHAYDRNILLNPDFDVVRDSQAFVDPAAFNVAMSHQLADDALAGDRYTVADEETLNLLETHAIHEDEALNEEYGYDNILTTGGQLLNLNEEDEYMMGYAAAQDDELLQEKLPLGEAELELIEPEPIGTQLKRMREEEAQQQLALAEPAAKKSRRAVPLARSRMFVFDSVTHVNADIFRHWLSDTSDITLKRPDTGSIEEILAEGNDVARDSYFHDEGFKVNEAMVSRSALQLFVENPAAQPQFEQFSYENRPAARGEQGFDFTVMYDEFGNVRSAEKMRAILSAHKRSTPGSGITTGFFNREKVTPSSLRKSAMSSGLGLASGGRLSFAIPEDAQDEEEPYVFEFDEFHVPGSEIETDFLARGTARRNTKATHSQPSLLETDEENIFAESPDDIGRASMNLLQFLSRAVFISEKADNEMDSISLSDLCNVNNLNRPKAARLFYQTLVLIGADYLTAFQDDSDDFGDITLIPGPRFEFQAVDEDTE